VTIDVDIIDDTTAAIAQHGGSVALPKMPIPGVGWLAYFKDTEGNIFGVMQSDETAG
jgi:predicted enzyme related to lactoylglutathione lyase